MTREEIDRVLSRLRGGFSSISEAKKELSDLGVVIEVVADDSPQIYRAVESLVGGSNG